MSVINTLLQFLGLRQPAAELMLPGEPPSESSEIGFRPTPENQLKYLYAQMWVDPTLRAAILDIRQMDRLDGRVKKLHRRTAALVVKGGLLLETKGANKRLQTAWDRFQARLHLDRIDKLKSDARGLMMEGNLPLQLVLNPAARQIAEVVRMPAETIRPRVGENGQFLDPRSAYEQYDLRSGRVIATFALWQLALVRLTPDNYDDMGCLGRPYLDASRTVWQKLAMTEEDLVIRRRTRAPLRLAHILKGMQEKQVDDYRAKVEANNTEITTDFFIGGDGRVDAVQGDVSLDQIADVVHLLDTFFAGSPAPKGLFGYTEGLSRDILEDLKRDYFEEVDAMQYTQAYAYELAFRLELMLSGINPDDPGFTVKFAERRTDTPNQRADLALKLQAMGASRQTIWRTAGLDPSAEVERLVDEGAGVDPYPDPGKIGKSPNVSITPGNDRKGNSATSITTRG